MLRGSLFVALEKGGLHAPKAISLTFGGNQGKLDGMPWFLDLVDPSASQSP
jgi:hypothetical protein